MTSFVRQGVLATVLMGAGALSHASITVAEYDLAPYNGDKTLEATTVAAGFAAGPITAVGALNGSFSNHFYFTGWSTTVDAAKYFEVNLSSPSSFSLDEMLFSVESTAGVQNSVVVRSGLDGFSADIDSFLWSSPTGDVTNGSFDLSSLGLLNNVTLRYYFTSASGANDNVGFANHELGGTGGGLPDTGRDISFTTVPLPPSLALLGLGLVGVGYQRRKQLRAL